MKKITKKAAAILALTLMAVMLAGAAGVAAVTNIGGEVEERDEMETAIQTAETARVYTVESVDGVIGVYYAGELVFLSDIAVSSLPTKDREALSEGIVVAEYEQVLSLLEDYSS